MLRRSSATLGERNHQHDLARIHHQASRVMTADRLRRQKISQRRRHHRAISSFPFTTLLPLSHSRYAESGI